eukprot:852736-Prorocentrum_minimum.AAC.1
MVARSRAPHDSGEPKALGVLPATLVMALGCFRFTLNLACLSNCGDGFIITAVPARMVSRKTSKRFTLFLCSVVVYVIPYPV